MVALFVPDMDLIIPSLYFRICILWPMKRKKFYLYLVVLSSLAVIFFLMNLLSAWKLWRWRQHAKNIADGRSDRLVMISSMNQDMKSLQYRLLLYNIFHTASMLIWIYIIYYFWENNEKFLLMFVRVLLCETEKTRQGRNNQSDYDACVTEYVSAPNVAFIYFLPFSTLLGLLAAFFFQYSRKANTRKNDNPEDGLKPLLDKNEASIVGNSPASARVLDDCATPAAANILVLDQSARICDETARICGKPVFSQHTSYKNNSKEAGSHDEKLILSRNNPEQEEDDGDENFRQI